MNKSASTRSKHFALHSLADGVFAAIAQDGGAAVSNSGLIDLGGQILVFDTFLTPQAAQDLLQSAIELLGRAPQLVVNSHYHNDHIWGNQVFLPEAQIISSTHTRSLITTAGMEEYNWYSENSTQRLAAYQTQLEETQDEEQRRKLDLWLGYYQGLVEALPRLAVCLPGVTFDGRLELHGAKQTAELLTFEGAHTGSDTVLFLPQAGIVFMSDLLFVGYHPYLADGDPLQLLIALRELSQLQAVCFVPGHGPAGTMDDLNLLIDYVEHCLETARMLVKEGNADKDRIAGLAIPEKFQHWQLPQFYQANMGFLCERMRSSQNS